MVSSDDCKIFGQLIMIQAPDKQKAVGEVRITRKNDAKVCRTNCTAWTCNEDKLGGEVSMPPETSMHRRKCRRVSVGVRKL